ncbi:MAG TPA: hypothetical protein VFN79_17965 [Steroidobacteraceae bacterium]|nr:hypothetical protein [Steroidobacteraceae bacterium]
MSAEKVGHTPGPWRQTGTFTVQDSRGNRVARTGMARPHAENEANAHLIASAPDLLAALQQLLDEQEDAPLERRRTEWAEACARARRAIAQAEGKA